MRYLDKLCDLAEAHGVRVRILNGEDMPDSLIQHTEVTRKVFAEKPMLQIGLGQGRGAANEPIHEGDVEAAAERLYRQVTEPMLPEPRHAA